MQISFPISSDMWMTSNSRLHWAEKARRTRKLRELGCMVGRSEINRLHLTRPVFSRCVVAANIMYPRRGRADPANAYPVIKALVDGLTDAGYWVDDDSEHVAKLEILRSPMRVVKGHHVTLTILNVGTMPETNLPIYKEQ